MMNRNVVSVWLLIVMLFGGACSNQAIYRNLQIQQQQACHKEPTPRAVRECLERADTSYETYRRQQASGA